jgi:hypothetical protein
MKRFLMVALLYTLSPLVFAESPNAVLAGHDGAAGVPNPPKYVTEEPSAENPTEKLLRTLSACLVGHPSFETDAARKLSKP